MLHPIATMMARRRAAIEASEKHGISRFEARRKTAALTDDQINEVATREAAKAGVALPEPSEGFGAIGDGSIIQSVKEFCDAHPELIKLIMSALLMIIGL